MYAEWETEVNGGLNELLQKEVAESSFVGSGAYYEALGHQFYALERYPDSIWAYQKTLGVSLGNQEAEKWLFQAQDKLGLNHDKREVIPEPLIYQSFALFFVLALLFFKFKKIRNTFFLLSSLSLLVLAYSVWFLPVEAIVLKASYLYQTPSKESIKVSKNPLPSGIKITVIDFSDDGMWLKVKDQESNIGYTFYDSLRLL